MNQKELEEERDFVFGCSPDGVMFSCVHKYEKDSIVEGGDVIILWDDSFYYTPATYNNVDEMLFLLERVAVRDPLRTKEDFAWKSDFYRFNVLLDPSTVFKLHSEHETVDKVIRHINKTWDLNIPTLGRGNQYE